MSRSRTIGRPLRSYGLFDPTLDDTDISHESLRSSASASSLLLLPRGSAILTRSVSRPMYLTAIASEETNTHRALRGSQAHSSRPYSACTSLGASSGRSTPEPRQFRGGIVASQGRRTPQIDHAQVRRVLGRMRSKVHFGSSISDGPPEKSGTSAPLAATKRPIVRTPTEPSAVSAPSVHRTRHTYKMSCCGWMAQSIAEWWGGFERPSRIANWLLLGDRDDAADLDLLLRHGVTHVLNVARQCNNYFPEHMFYTKMDLEDSRKQEIRSSFDSAFKAIEHARDMGGCVLVHCVAGVSRSATLVLAYLVVRERMWLRDAVHFVKQRRPIIRPNTGFLTALARFEVEVRGVSSVAASIDPMWQFDAMEAIRRSLPVAHISPPPNECWFCCCCFTRCYHRLLCGWTSLGISLPCQKGGTGALIVEPTGGVSRSVFHWCRRIGLDVSCSLPLVADASTGTGRHTLNAPPYNGRGANALAAHGSGVQMPNGNASPPESATGKRAKTKTKAKASPAYRSILPVRDRDRGR